MRRLLAPLAVAGVLALPAQTAAAQTSFSTFNQFGPASTVAYHVFHVSVGGTFTIQTSGLNAIDPMIWLFAGKAFAGPDLGTAIAFNDDGAPAQAGFNRCTGAVTPGQGGTCHSLLSVFLAAGDYTVATGAFNLTEAEARAGVATFGTDANYGLPYCNADADWSDCNFTVAVSSTDGTAVGVVPEPVTIILVASGLLGIGGAARRRRRNPEA